MATENTSFREAETLANNSTYDIAHLISWEVLTDPMGSDHFPILLTLNTNIDRNVINPATKWNDNRAHWMTFQSTMNNKKINSNFEANNNDEMLEMFKTAIAEAADANCPTQNNNVIRQILSHHNIETEIYTDGSKSIHGVGSAYFVPNQKHTFRVKLPDLSSIYTAEALAIEKALEWCSKNSTRKIAILSDSQSVLKAMEANPHKHHNDIPILKIRQLVQELKNMKKDIIFIIMDYRTQGHHRKHKG
nr:unnamed protein product [Callosobruchus chinensis]